MRTAYIKVDLEDSQDSEIACYIVSPVPFVCHYGDILIPPKSQQRTAWSYTELCRIFKTEFQIPESLLPPAKYFRPTRAEELAECSHIYRAVPEGTGEPDWRVKARQAIISALEDDDTIFEKGRIVLNDRVCYSMEELRLELTKVAEQAGGRQRVESDAYQPDYNALVTEILEGYSALVAHSELRQRLRKE